MMEKLDINADTGKSTILFGESIDNLDQYLPNEKVIVLTDTLLNKFYHNKFSKYKIIEIGLGEGIKTLETLDFIFNKLIEYEVDRSYFLIGVGGGIVCDIAGFVASIYMRGIPFGFVSTSLLSMVDASVGGKNGVNYKGYKNMIGVFNQPKFVICDYDLLETLDKQEFIAGFAEIVKHAAIKNRSMFTFLEQNYQKALNIDKEVIHKLVYDSVIIKSAIVEEDEKEKGERRKLNFGHTFAHSIEKLTHMKHGEAVSIGMVLASKLSQNKGILTNNETMQIERLLTNLKLPVKLDLNKNDMFDAMKKDKKREGNAINFVLLNGIGNAVIQKISINEMEEIVNDLC